jgi:hypothetical protein
MNINEGVARIVLLLVIVSTPVFAEPPAFSSKLFDSGTLVYADDFDDGTYKGRYGHHKVRKKVEDGTLVIPPLDPERGYVLGMIYQLPKKFVCHFRYKRISKSADHGAGFSIGSHKMNIVPSKQDGKIVDGYNLLFRAKRPFTSIPHKGPVKLLANEWHDVVIEYEQGKMLLKINGEESIFEDARVNVENSNQIIFKCFSAESLHFDYVRLWKIDESEKE